MVTKDLQTFNLKFDQVMYNSLVLTWKRNFEVMFGIFSVKMCDKMAISAYILKIVEKGQLLRLQMRAKEMFNRNQFFSTNKQYVKIKLMQNEANRWSIFLVKTKYW